MTFWKMTWAVTLGILIATFIQYLIAVISIIGFTVLTTP